MKTVFLELIISLASGRTISLKHEELVYRRTRRAYLAASSMTETNCVTNELQTQSSASLKFMQSSKKM